MPASAAAWPGETVALHRTVPLPIGGPRSWPGPPIALLKRHHAYLARRFISRPAPATNDGLRPASRRPCHQREHRTPVHPSHRRNGYLRPDDLPIVHRVRGPGPRIDVDGRSIDLPHLRLPLLRPGRELGGCSLAPPLAKVLAPFADALPHQTVGAPSRFLIAAGCNGLRRPKSGSPDGLIPAFGTCRHVIVVAILTSLSYSVALREEHNRNTRARNPPSE